MMFAREDASVPDPIQAAWLYAQMVRWRQTAISLDALRAAQEVFRPDLYEAAFGRNSKLASPSGAITAFAGPAFDPTQIERHLEAFPPKPGAR